MVKSSSCFKLITCGGGDGGDKDGDYQYQPISENKDSNDKRGWSFRKRSARHRVLSNTVITETQSSANKVVSESTSINFPPVAEPDAVEKTYTTILPDDKPLLSSLESSQIPETIVPEVESKVDVNNPPESDVIVIQAAIRGFLARRDLLKNKNAVKLQAAVRGHLVRRHAVGTLRCVQAIAKMQVLVRARHAQKVRLENHSNHKGDEHPVTKSNVEHTSVDKLLSNRFARQLLESTPKNKPIKVKCDPSKGDSAWRWLERWMSVSSTADSAENKKEIRSPEQSEENKEETKESNSVPQLERGISAEVYLQLADSKLIVIEPPIPPFEDKEKKKTNYDADNFDSEASLSSFSFVKDNMEEAPEKTTTTIHDTKVTSTEIDSSENEKTESGASFPQETSSVDKKSGIDGEQDTHSKKTFALDQLEAEGKKFVHGSRKTSNPAFIAVQSKFEEMTSGNSGKSSSLSNQDAPVESQVDTSSGAADAAYRPKELFSPINPATYPSLVLGSECGTELSITSTLDSPDDGSDVGSKESEHDAKDSAKGNPEIKTDHGLEGDKILQADLAAKLPNSNLDGETVDDTGADSTHSGIVVNSEEVAVNSEQNAYEILRLRELEEALQRDSKLSPETSPRSQQYQLGTPSSSHLSMTILELQETPSSQVSIKSKESKTKKNGSGNKRKILSSGNKSANNANHDSGSREQHQKDQPSGKRRSSFSSAKPDDIDQEATDNSCSNNSSIPRFMLATESARAKMNAINSPRSSPDVHDQDVITKKRHSLPGATGRQDSPRVHRSPQQSSKANGLHVHHERKWQR